MVESFPPREGHLLRNHARERNVLAPFLLKRASAPDSASPVSRPKEEQKVPFLCLASFFAQFAGRQFSASDTFLMRGQTETQSFFVPVELMPLRSPIFLHSSWVPNLLLLAQVIFTRVRLLTPLCPSRIDPPTKLGPRTSSRSSVLIAPSRARHQIYDQGRMILDLDFHFFQCLSLDRDRFFFLKAIGPRCGGSAAPSGKC